MSVDRRRWGVVIGATIAMGVAAAPAYAEPDPGQVSAQLDNVTIGAAGAMGKVRSMVVSATNATDPTVVLDLAALDGIAVVDFPRGDCRLDGKAATCGLRSGAAFTDRIPVRFRPAPGAKAGDSAEITYTAAATGLPAVARKAKITIAHGPDLVALSGGESKPAALGDKVTVRVAFQNVGSTAGAGFTMTFKLSHGLKADAYSNCTYADWPAAHGQLVECTFTEVLEPGRALVGGIVTTVQPTAFGSETVEYTVEPTASAATLDVRRATGLDAADVDIDSSDNAGTTSFTGITNTLDVSGVGATVSGPVGITVTAKIGLRNNGAAALDSFGSPGPVIRFAFAVPTGAEVVSAPTGCASITENGPPQGEPGRIGGTYYVCDHPGVFLGAGESFLLEFGLKIVAASSGTVSADIRTNNPVVYPDDKAANNTAAVTVTIPAAAGGGLPITGRSTDRLVLAGALMLALGVALLVATRRHESRTTP